MGNLNQPEPSSQPPSNGKFAILKRCREVDDSLKIVKNDISELQYLQRAAIDDPDSSQNSRTTQQLNAKVAGINTAFQGLTKRVTDIKTTPDAGSNQNVGQVKLVEKNLRDTMNEYQQVDVQFRKQLEAQTERQFRIVKPNATEEEVRQVISEPSGNTIFAQAVSLYPIWPIYFVNLNASCNKLVVPAMSDLPWAQTRREAIRSSRSRGQCRCYLTPTFS